MAASINAHMAQSEREKMSLTMSSVHRRTCDFWTDGSIIFQDCFISSLDGENIANNYQARAFDFDLFAALFAASTTLFFF